MKTVKSPKIKLTIYQQDWIPGFAAFIFENGKIKKGKDVKANLVLNIGSFIAAVKVGDVEKKEIPYFITETIIHELVHVLQAYFKEEFSEKKIHKLTEKYQKVFDLENSDDSEARKAYKKLKNK